MTAVLDEGP